MINLYIFNQTSPGAVFGVGTYIRELTAALKGSDINVCVIHLRSEKLDMETELLDGIRHWHIPAPTAINLQQNYEAANERYHRNILYLLQLYIVERKENLIFHINYMNCKPLADALKSTFDCKSVLVVHYLDSIIALMGNISRLRRIISQTDESTNAEDKSVKLFLGKEKELLQSSSIDKIICLSNHAYNLLLQDYHIDKEKIVVIYNGLTDMVDTSAGVRNLRKKWNVPHNEKIILFAGRMDEIKGLGYLLKAFREVLKIYPKCRLVIAGNGSYDKYTKESYDICTKITYTGLLEKPQLYEWYRMADVGVTPSLFEPFGYVTLEMMMHNLPVVATATSGLNEVADDTCGFKVPLTILPDSVEIDHSLLSQKICYLLQHPAEARKMGHNGRQRYLKKFSAKIFRDNMLRFYTGKN